MAERFDRDSQNKQAWRHRPSQRLLFSALVFLIVLLLVVSFTLTSLDSYRRHVKLAENEVLNKAHLIATAHEQWLSEVRGQLASMAVGLSNLKNIQAGCQSLLQQYLAVSEGMDSALLLDARGNLICAPLPTSRSLNFSDRLYFQRALQQKTFAVGRLIVGRVSGERVLSMAYPLLDRRGEVNAVLVTGRKIEWLKSVLARQYVDSGIGITVVDGAGTVLAHGPDVPVELERPYPDEALRQAIGEGKSGVLNIQLKDHGEYLVAYTRLGPDESDVYVLVSQATARVLQPTLTIIRGNLLQFLLTMLLVIGALWVGLGHWVLEPLQRLADSMGLIRAGKSGVRVEDMGPSRELVAIGENFNDMLYTLETTSKELRKLADNDALLGIPNRRLLDEKLHSEWRRLSRSDEPLSFLMIDVDLFKNYNDHYGHQAGDDCLKVVTAVIRSVLNRPADMLARYGGEEFAVLLPETGEKGACNIARGIQESMAHRRIPHEASSVADYVTLSIGVSTVVPSPKEHADKVIEIADKALYKAKATGRNRIEVENP